eukprot:GHRR01002814.1.p2 GENE.GHRR01002814.1~~GHRR01002814.1.p2  ORF type:complete len:104 (+),score=23.33 GHRR01002814.1:1011-1322(+)
MLSQPAAVTQSQQGEHHSQQPWQSGLLREYNVLCALSVFAKGHCLYVCCVCKQPPSLSNLKGTNTCANVQDATIAKGWLLRGASLPNMLSSYIACVDQLIRPV